MLRASARVATLSLCLLAASRAGAEPLPPRTAAQIADNGFGMDSETPLSQDPLGSSLTTNIVAAASGRGVKWLRVWASWRVIETSPNPGIYSFAGLDNLVNAAHAQGMKVFITLDGSGQSLYAGGAAPTSGNGAMTPWLNFVSAVVSRYKGSVDAWEVWNEPNLGWSPAVSPSAYAYLVSQTAPLIRAAQPSAFLILGGTSLVDLTYLQAVLPTVGGLVNAVGIHPYRQFPEQAQDAFIAISTTTLPPNGIKPNASFTATGASSYAGEIGLIKSMLSTLGLSTLQIWSTETGYPAENESQNLWPGSVPQQAKNLARYYMENLSLGVARSVYFVAEDVDSIYMNYYTAPGQPFLDDYRLSPRVATAGFFTTFSPLYVEPGTSILVPATAFSASSNIAVSGATIAATAVFPNNYADYTGAIPAGNYLIWLHEASTTTVNPTVSFCTINGSSVTVSATGTYNYLASNFGPMLLQGNSDYTQPYYSPCSYNGPNQVYYPVVVTTTGTATTLRVQLLDAGTKIDEIRLQPLGPLTTRTAYTALASLAVLFDDTVSLAGPLATFSNVGLTGAQYASLITANFVNQHNVPVIAFWVATQPVDAFAGGSVRVTLPSDIDNPVLIDPLQGTVTSLGGGVPAASFVVGAQDYPLILTSFSALNAAAVPTAGTASAKAYPNPFVPSLGHTTITFTNMPAEARVRLYTLNGQLVADLTADSTGTAVWDATNRSGRPVASGVYFAFIQGGGHESTLKVAIQR
jgi:hypothetical protein